MYDVATTAQRRVATNERTGAEDEKMVRRVSGRSEMNCILRSSLMSARPLYKGDCSTLRSAYAMLQEPLAPCLQEISFVETAHVIWEKIDQSSGVRVTAMLRVTI
jgi:hypothetical protein